MEQPANLPDIKELLDKCPDSQAQTLLVQHLGKSDSDKWKETQRLVGIYNDCSSHYMDGKGESGRGGRTKKEFDNNVAAVTAYQFAGLLDKSGIPGQIAQVTTQQDRDLMLAYLKHILKLTTEQIGAAQMKNAKKFMTNQKKIAKQGLWDAANPPPVGDAKVRKMYYYHFAILNRLYPKAGFTHEELQESWDAGK